jgi:hypothetical protein
MSLPRGRVLGCSKGSTCRRPSALEDLLTAELEPHADLFEATHCSTSVVRYEQIAFIYRLGTARQQQGKFARGVYALISDEGVHPLMGALPILPA